ncbi:MAG: tyrosine-type recombinase/integrase, partial [Gammaproteobacteria bacterium]|nr:tyrosine-type recombinase/integrase [Gammaproteobacteria bacterium]
LIHLDRMFEYDERKIVIPFNQVGRFIDLLERLKNDPKLTRGERWTIRVYLVSLFLGMRNEEARMMKWEYIDLDTGYFKLPGKIVKNNKDHHKAISGYALSILKEMHEERNDSNNPYVFQTPSRKRRHKGKFISPMRLVQKMVIEGMGGGFEYEPHALRRTFISLADAINIPRKVLKNLVNHISGDVTDGYCVKGFNPKQEAPHLNRIEQAFLILRDKYRNGEDLPDLVEDIFPKEESAELTTLRKKLAQMEAEQNQLNALRRELKETKAALIKAKREYAYRAKTAVQAQV